MFVKVESWNFQYLFDLGFREALQTYSSFIQTFRRHFCIGNKELSKVREFSQNPKSSSYWKFHSFLSWQIKKFSVYFLLFPYPKFFLFFGISLSNLEKIGIDEKVICYHNISNLLWEKDVLCAWKRKWISKTLQILGLTASNLQTFSSIHFFFLTLEQFFLTVR